MEGYRQKKLHEIITDANVPLQDLIACQKVIIKEDYINSLKEEDIAIDTYYGDIITNLVRKDYFIDKINIQDYYGDIIIDAKKQRKKL